MVDPCTFDALLGIVHQRSTPWPDHRTGNNIPYSIHDAVVGALGIFCTQAPAFLDDQRTLQHAHGDNTAQTLVGVHHIPCDHQVCTRLDPLVPSPLDGVLLTVFAGLGEPGGLRAFRVLNDPLLMARDGTPYFSSQTMHGSTCLTRHTLKGPTLSSHEAIPPVVVCPGRAQGLPLPPSTSYRTMATRHKTVNGRRGNGGYGPTRRRWHRMA